MARPILLLAGIPATGKSNFGRWLEETKGFLHVDMENEGLDKHGLRATWEEFLRKPASPCFVQQLEADPRPVALDWGFPVACLPIVRALQDHGVHPWWFTGDRIRARQIFEESGKGQTQAFDQQYANVSADWSLIAPVFGQRIVRTVPPQGELLLCEQIYQQISKTGDVDA